MNWLLYLAGRLLISFVQAWPLDWVARMGRVAGAIGWRMDRRHRRVALSNLERVLGSVKPPEERRAIARENFLRLGENYLCALKTASMSSQQLEGRLEWAGLEQLPKGVDSVVGVIGHFGNFELFARVREVMPGWTAATTYRALRQPGLNRVFQDLRGRSGTLFFERRSESEALRQAMSRGRILLALLSDQHAGDKGAWLPFLGVPCSCSTAPALMALRYRSVLASAICYRVGLARWRIEVGAPIPTHLPDGTPRDVVDITRDATARLEEAVLRDPANWFWVHRRWKPQSRHQAAQERREPEAARP